MSKKQDYKLDIFKVLEAIDKRDFGFYKNLSDEEKKNFAGIVAMRWLSSVSGSKDLQEYYVLAVNETANKNFWSSGLKDHPELQYLTLARAGCGAKQRHEWIKGPTKKSSNKIYDFLKKYYPTANIEELDLFFEKNTLEDMIEIAKMLGMQDDEIKEIRKELKKIK